MNYLQRIKKKLDKDGLEHVISYLLKKIGYKTKYSSLAEKKKILLSKEIYKITKGKTVFGLYTGTRLKYYHNCSNKLTGQFERQVQEAIFKIKKDYNLSFLVNFGAGEGFHTIGPIRNKWFSRAVVFENDINEKKVLLENIKINKCNNKIKVLNDANFEDVNRNFSKKELKKALFLVDIEGEEFHLFNKNNIDYFKNSFLIIECHDFYIKDKKTIKNFYSLLNKNFKINTIYSSSRNPFLVKELDGFTEQEKWLSIIESRQKPMHWIVCVPRKN
tara:strand:- start:26 stop:847 length:822 start_codon:yes stop_codon:yes gene_type:complete